MKFAQHARPPAQRFARQRLGIDRAAGGDQLAGQIMNGVKRIRIILAE